MSNAAPCSGPRSTASKRLLVGGKINRFIPNPTFDPVARPGCLDEYFRAKTCAQGHPRGVR